MIINFINLDNGLVYNGDQPYIHWLGNECSTNLIYNNKLCILSDEPVLPIELNSDVFNLINIDEVDNISDESINGFKYKDIEALKVSGIYNSTGTEYADGDRIYYIHIIYIIASSDYEGEFIDELKIKDNTYLIGIEFYTDNEALSINLSNFGVNIPNEIQKSIYPLNVHEDKIDNILMNRKWKELISNYWDVIANKGSYNSLINSLKWFEWENINIKEIWKYNDLDKTVLEERDLKTVIENYYKDTLCRFAKTTYISISLAMQSISNNLDDQKNPYLEKITYKWSKEDLILKLSLLGNFYETYFMPIHLDLIQCTIEDIVFTNTFKLFNSGAASRVDEIIPPQNIICNIKNNQSFNLSNVSCQVGPKTIFGNKSRQLDYNNIITIGVDPVVGEISENDLNIFWSQYYNGIGVIVPVEVVIQQLKDNFIKSGYINIRKNDVSISLFDNFLIHPDENGDININFNLLFKTSGIYDVKMQFTSASSEIFTYNVQINVIDVSSVVLKVCKVIKNNFPRLTDWYSVMSNDYNINRFISTNTGYDTLVKQYIPVKIDKDSKNIALNNILIFKSEETMESELVDFSTYLFWVDKKYFVTHKKLRNEDKGTYILYTICVSKEFWFDPNNYISEYLKQYVYRNDYGYFPEFHSLKEIGGDKLSDYVIMDDEAICVVPVFKINNTEIPFRIGNEVSGVEWSFENTSLNEVINIPGSVREPYILKENREYLSHGYYDIKFKYNLSGVDKEILVNSAFIKA